MFWAEFDVVPYHTFLPPVNCGIPHAPENGTIENIQGIRTVGGSQILFRCNPRYVPAGRMNATCVSPDGISAVGTWTPDPADLVCNGEIVYEKKLLSSFVDYDGYSSATELNVYMVCIWCGN